MGIKSFLCTENWRIHEHNVHHRNHRQVGRCHLYEPFVETVFGSLSGRSCGVRFTIPGAPVLAAWDHRLDPTYLSNDNAARHNRPRDLNEPNLTLYKGRRLPRVRLSRSTWKTSKTSLNSAQRRSPRTTGAARTPRHTGRGGGHVRRGIDPSP